METLEAIQARHRKEQRDLQSRITSKKKNATKKTRKGVNDECADLERQLKERQAQELSGLSGEPDGPEGDEGEEQEQGEINGVSHEGGDDKASNGLAEQLKNTSISDSSAPAPSSQLPSTPTQDQGQSSTATKRNRQKDRLARRAAEQEAAAAAAEAEAANMTDHRKIEKTYLLREFKANGLVEKEIQPDGHCLFSAVADQLAQASIPLGGGGGDGSDAKGPTTTMLPYKVVRRRAAEYMLAHPDDFAPFLEEGLEGYARKMRDTAEWGGQLELTALANVYGVEIKVLQDGRTETIEPAPENAAGEDRGKVWLAYYRHGYGLGEHYNSLRKAG
jgi:OTU domain-containing protein 6